MIHHVSLGTDDIARSRAFYDAVLAILGIRLLNSDAESADYGSARSCSASRPRSTGSRPRLAMASTSPSLRAAERWSKNSTNGGSDAGAPGLRPEYDAHYFGAFVYDPDGNKIEAVTFSAK